MGGGGLRGMSHIGVLQVLWENQIRISMIGGTSAGSIFATLYACGVSPWSMEEFALQLKPRDYLDYNWFALMLHLLSGGKIPFNGFIKGDKLEQMMNRLTGERTFDDCTLPLVVIACDINTGEKIVFSNKQIRLENPTDQLITKCLLSQAVRASCAIPGVFTPYYLDDLQLVDGGVMEMVPVLETRSLGADYVLSINLGEKEYDRKVRGVIQIMGRSLDILQFETSSLAQDIYADQVVYPYSGEVALDDIGQAAYLIRSGRRAMKAQIPQLLHALNH